MNRTKLEIFESTCVALPLTNIDTDQIIPARFLTTTVREGLGDKLFYDWRYDEEGKINPGFVLNMPSASGRILVTGNNFGCGSSREHAVWAICDYGFRVVISDSFADIFRNNALNNGLLPVVVSGKMLAELLTRIKEQPETKVKVDLAEQKVTIIDTGAYERFEINPHRKECLLKGLDDIDFLLEMMNEITAFERNHNL